MTAVNSRFMVIGLTGLVLRDLVGTMREIFPTLEACTVDDEDHALAMLSDTGGWDYAFVNLGPDAFVQTPLSALFDALGTKVILLGNDAEDMAEISNFPVLVRPFTANDVLQLVDRKSDPSGFLEAV